MAALTKIRWTGLRRVRCAVLAAMASTLALIAPAWADFVVLSSTVPAIAAGTVIADDAAVSVPEGGLLAVLSKDGRSITLQGPHDGPVTQKKSASDGVVVAVVGRLLRSGELEKTALGASRAGGDQVLPVGVTGLPAFAGGTFCVADSGLTLLRTDSSKALKATIKQTDSGNSAALFWAAGQSAVPWPSTLPLEAGGYRLVAKGALKSAAVTLHLMPKTVRDPAARAAWMIERACRQQAALLLVALRSDNVPFQLYLTSDRGRAPTYKIGEHMTLFAKSSREAHLYCYVYSADGPAVAIFPSPASKGARIAGSDLLELPGNRLAVDLQAAAPPGAEFVDCFATEKSADGHLPKALMFNQFQPIDTVKPENLLSVFKDLPTGNLAHASLKITVAR